LIVRARIRNDIELKDGLLDSSVESSTDSSTPITDQFLFEPVKTPVGNLSAMVEYRRNCNFAFEGDPSFFDDFEIGETEFRGRRRSRTRRRRGFGAKKRLAAGSLSPLWRTEAPDLAQAYGSLSTFHIDARCESPMTVLREAPVWGSDDVEDFTP